MIQVTTFILDSNVLNMYYFNENNTNLLEINNKNTIKFYLIHIYFKFLKVIHHLIKLLWQYCI